MAVEASFMDDVYTRLQLTSCGQLLEFIDWGDLASQIGLTRQGRAVKNAVYWLEKSSTARVKHTSPIERQSGVQGHNGQDKHSILVPLSTDQQKVLDRIAAAPNGCLTVIINGARRAVLTELFEVSDAITILDAFVKKGRLDKVVNQDRKLTETYALLTN